MQKVQFTFWVCSSCKAFLSATEQVENPKPQKDWCERNKCRKTKRSKCRHRWDWPQRAQRGFSPTSALLTTTDTPGVSVAAQTHQSAHTRTHAGERTHTYTPRCGTTDCPSFRRIPVVPSVSAVCRIYSPSICLCQGKTRDVIAGDTNQSSWRRVGWLELIHSPRDWHKCPHCSFHIRKLKTFKGAGHYRTWGLTA